MIHFIPILLLSLQIFSFDLKTDKEKYYRYEIVKVKFKYPYSKNIICVGNVYFNDELVEGITGKKEFKLKYDKKEKIWKINWPIPYAPKLGTYTLEVKVYERKNEEYIEINSKKTKFEIIGRSSKPIQKGFCVLTVEQLPTSYKYYPSPFSNTKSWKSIIEWAKFIGADALWCLIGQTQIWKKKGYEFPWSNSSIKIAKEIAKETKENGIKFGAWLCVNYVWSNNDYHRLTGYKFATGLKNGVLTQTKFLSLNEEKRKKDIISLMKILNEDENIDFIGLDYVRTDEFGGYEYVDEFVNDMEINIPENWNDMSKEERMMWLAKKVSPKTKDKIIYSCWGWWRAHKMAMYIKDIIDEVKPKKPVFAFTLGWQQGKQHGQDPLMFIDAGIDINTIMLYHSKEEFDSMLKDWAMYLKEGKSSYILGEIVYFEEYGKSKIPPSPNLAIERHIKAYSEFLKYQTNVGIYWHDLQRIFGKIARGPYTGMEWIIAGGESFTKFREITQRLPFKITLEVPDEVIINQDFKVKVKIENVSNLKLKEIKVEMIDFPYIEMKKNNTIIQSLEPNKEIVVSFPVKIVSFRPSCANRAMIAVRVEKLNSTPQNKGFKFKYIKINEKGNNN
jgi:hypothetical protein